MALFDQWASTYDQTVYAAEPADGFEQYDLILSTVADLAGVGPGSRVLDVGAGTGNLTLAVAATGAEVTAVEPSAEMRRVAGEKLGRQRVLDGHFRSLPVANETCDAIVSTYAFHHLTDEQKRLGVQELKRALKPGGRVVIGDIAWADETARQQMIDRFVRQGKLDLVREMEEEYYPLIEVLRTMFQEGGFQVTVRQMTDWVWVLRGVKEAKGGR